MTQLKSIRQTFLPDEGEIFVRVDLSQSEDRFSKMYCGTERMIALANRRPEVYDAHTDNAKKIFKKEEISKQERYLGKKAVHASVDKRTEFLTKRGFVFAPDLTIWDEVAQWDIRTGMISFVKPLELFSYPYTGRMLRFRGSFLSQYVTADHRIPYSSNGSMKWAYADRIPKSGAIPLSGVYAGGCERLNPLFTRLLVAFQADGTIMENGCISWHLKKERKIARLLGLLRALDIPYTFIEGKSDDVYVRIHKPYTAPLFYWLPEKRWSSRLLKLCHTSLEDILDELRYWDGDDMSATNFKYRSSDVGNINWIQIISHLCGFRAVFSVVEPSETSFSDRKSYCLYASSSRKSAEAGRPHIEYRDNFTVYCMSVPSGFMVMRRNGCVSITGNSVRGLRGDKLSESISKDTEGKLFLPAKQCQKMIDEYLDAMWEMRDIYMPWVRERVRMDRMLVNSWGRRLNLKYRRIDDDLYRVAYSFYPQAENADLTNQYLYIPTYYYMMGKYGKPPSAQVHDEVIVSVPLEGAWDVADFMVSSVERPREVPAGSGNYLTVPAEVTIGRNWGDPDGVEFKKLPEKGEFYQKLKEGGFEGWED